MACVANNFLMNRTFFVDGDKLSPVIKHGFLRSEENVFPVILNTHKVYGKMFSFIIFNIYVWLVLLPYQEHQPYINIENYKGKHFPIHLVGVQNYWENIFFRPEEANFDNW